MGKKESPFRKKTTKQKQTHPKRHTVLFFDSGVFWVPLARLTPLPHNANPNPAWPRRSPGQCPWRPSPSFSSNGVPRLCQATESKWKTSEATGTGLVLSSRLSVMQRAGSPPVSHILQATLAGGQVHTLLHAAAVSCHPNMFYIPKASLQFNVLRISKDRQKSVCLLKKKKTALKMDPDKSSTLLSAHEFYLWKHIWSYSVYETRTLDKLLP